jgi:hypothetical protein
MTLRQLRVMVENLPNTSATYARMQGTPWTDAEFLLHGLINEMRQLIAVVQWTGSGKYRQPEFLPLPTEVAQERERKARASEAALAYIDDYRKQRGS